MISISDYCDIVNVKIITPVIGRCPFYRDTNRGLTAPASCGLGGQPSIVAMDWHSARGGTGPWWKYGPAINLDCIGWRPAEQAHLLIFWAEAFTLASLCRSEGRIGSALVLGIGAELAAQGAAIGADSPTGRQAGNSRIT